MAETEYLVFVEEDETEAEEDRLVFQLGRTPVRALGDLEIHPDIEVELVNASSRMATAGLATGLFGSLVGLAALVTFAVSFPGDWFNAAGNLQYEAPVVWFTALFAVVAGGALVLGAVLTYYGRRLQARGRVRGIQVTQRTPDEHAVTE